MLDVVHVRKEKVRGTAFLVFRDLASSTAAMRGLDGEGFYGKSLVRLTLTPQRSLSLAEISEWVVQRIAYAKSTSHATVALHEGPEAVYAIKLGLRELDGTATHASKLTVSGAQKKLLDEKRKEKRGREDEDEEEEEEDDEDEERPEKKKGKQQQEEDEDDGMFPSSRSTSFCTHSSCVGVDAMDEESDDDTPAPTAPMLEQAGSVPTPVLYVSGLPQEVTTDMLSALFQQ